MSSATAVKRSLQGLEEGLTAFTTQLAQETAELKRNVDNRPTTGATFYSRILMDLAERLDAVDQELFALERLSLDAVSLEELVGHSVALYRHNHLQIQQLETTLAQYGYRDLYAPLPPDNPLDMLELSAAAGSSRADAAAEAEQAAAEDAGAQHCGGDVDADAEAGALGDLTNRVASSHLGPACDASPQRAGVQGGGVPRTTLKALAPMTAGRALLARADTPPSSIASPDALSPSMRQLLGKYAASSGGGTQPQALSEAPPPSAATPGGAGGRAGGTPPLPAYLSPAFQLAAMEQEVQMAHAAAAAAPEAAQQAATPPPSSWPADDALREALTATARKLQGAPSFLEAYRQRFPAIVASTERLLQTVEKQRRPTAAAAVAQEEAAGGPVAALAMAAQQAAGPAAPRPALAEESTIDLMVQVLGHAAGQRHQGRGAGDGAAALDAAATCSTRFHAGGAGCAEAAVAPAHRQPGTPDAAALLSHASDGTARGAFAAAGAAAHPINSLRGDDPEQLAACDGVAAPAPLQSVPLSQRSKPQLEEAIAAALARGRAAPARQAAAAAAAPPAPTPAPPAPPAADRLTHAAAAGPVPTPAPPPPPAADQLVPASAAPAHAPPCPPLAAAAAAAPAPAAAGAVPELRLVGGEEYAALPTFIKSQLPLELLNATLGRVHAAAAGRGGGGFTMADVEEAGLGAKCKVVVNSLVKLGRAQLRVLPGSGTLYLLV